MLRAAAEWLSKHVTGPNAECGPFHCFWCGGSITTHQRPCPAYDAIHQLDIKVVEEAPNAK